MTPVLDCYIFSLFPDNIIDNFYFIEKCYMYNSLQNKEYNISSNLPFSIQVPEFLIQQRDLLDKIDFDFLHTNHIEVPVIRNDGESWIVDLKHYNETYNNLQSRDS